MSDALNSVGVRLNELLANAGQPLLDSEQTKRFEAYLSLILRWNVRVNLTAIRDEEGILNRHFVESIACAHALPAGIATLLDFGSGAGLPGIPIAICRPEISVTLAESQGKKAAFLREALRQLGLEAKQLENRLAPKGGGGFNPRITPAKSERALAPAGCTVHHGRAEELRILFDCIILRAVDKMEVAVIAATQLLRPGGYLALMTTTAGLPALQSAAGPEFTWHEPQLLPGSEECVLALGERAISLPA